MNLDAIINIVSFVVGLTIGLVQLYVAQHQFEVQQREKMDELRKTLAEILQKIAILEATNSTRAYDVQDKLLQMAAGKAAVNDFTEETAGKLKELVNDEIEAAGIKKNSEQIKKLEEKVASIVEKTVNSTGIIATSFGERERGIEQVILSEVAQGKSLVEIAALTSLNKETIHRLARRLYTRFDVKDEIELQEKLSSLNQPSLLGLK